MELGFQAWIAYNLRFILSGDLDAAWGTFGGISMQLTHLGTGLNSEITENATIAMTYDAEIRTYSDELSKFRTREKEITNLLKEEGRSVKREGIRERGAATTFAPRNADLKRKKDKQNAWKGQDKGRKGKGRTGKGKNKFRGKMTGDRIPTGVEITTGGFAHRTIGETTNLRLETTMVVRPPRRPATRKLRRPPNLRRGNKRNSKV